MGFWSSFGGINLFTHAGKDGLTPMERLKRDTSTYQNGRNLNFMIYAGIGKIRLIRQKVILADGLDFNIG